MRLTAGLDSGPVCLTGSLAIDPDDTYGSLAERLQSLGGELLVQTLDLIAAGAAPEFVEQDESGVTYAEKIDRRGPAARSGALGTGAGAHRQGAATTHRRAPGPCRREPARCS